MEDNVPEVIIKNWELAEIQQPEDNAKILTYKALNSKVREKTL